jgi:hypothetical protein
MTQTMLASNHMKGFSHQQTWEGQQFLKRKKKKSIFPTTLNEIIHNPTKKNNQLLIQQRERERDRTRQQNMETHKGTLDSCLATLVFATLFSHFSSKSLSLPLYICAPTPTQKHLPSTFLQAVVSILSLQLLSKQISFQRGIVVFLSLLNNKKMEAMKMKVFAVLMVVLMAFSTMQKATAANAPAPSPTSDATIFVPTFLASFVALAFGFFL